MTQDTTRKSLLGVQIAYNQWTQLQDQIAHGDNEYEREQLIHLADAHAEPWRTGDHAEDWRYLDNLHTQWQTDPDAIRERTDIALRNHTLRRGGFPVDGPVEDPRHARHMSYMKFFFDPVEKEKRDWHDMHIRRAELSGELAAARDDTEADAIEARIAELDDTTNWPASWHACEAEVRDDPQHWHDQSERANEHYEHIIRTREAAAAAPTTDQEETEELEEAPWGA